MKIRYLLKKKPGPLPYQIFIALYDNNSTELIYTGERTSGTKSDWDAKKGQPKDQLSDHYNRLEKLKAEVQKTIQWLESSDAAITPYTVKSTHFQRKQDKELRQSETETKEKKGAKTIYALAKTYQENLPVGMKQSTKKTLKISIDVFRNYLEQSGNRSLPVKDFDLKAALSYQRYLLERRKLEPSTTNKRTKHLSWFLKSIDSNTKIPPLKVRRQMPIALTVAELKALETVRIDSHPDVKSHVFMERARDLFLLGCYTGLRISDLRRLNPVNTSNTFISLTQQKNGRNVSIPVVPQAKEILMKYEWHCPKISEQELNLSIKSVCEHAGIDRLVEREANKGGILVTRSVPLWRLITSHIAGKTFISNAKELYDLDPEEVAAIVGKDIKTLFNHYHRPQVESAIKKMQTAVGIMKVA
ncbi:MAG: phage integrase SAM-like domain-containing protein [Bacteroidetes bacterium]|nr:phage integrase SAM-like domain-containing protein [Bacteroidota bacterium]